MLVLENGKQSFLLQMATFERYSSTDLSIISMKTSCVGQAENNQGQALTTAFNVVFEQKPFKGGKPFMN